MAKTINYRDDPRDAGTIVVEEGISRDDITEEERARTHAYLEGVLTGPDSGATWAFTLKGVTIEGKGWDEAGNFIGRYS